MKKKLVVLINNGATHKEYVDLLRLRYEVELVQNSDIQKSEDVPSIDLILFTGGEDVSPKYYGERRGKFTSVNEDRDAIESKMFKRVSSRTPKLGICRGAQFLTVMNGGRLIQHVENHGIGGTHQITFDYMNKGAKMNMTSTHHQMMYPYNLDRKDFILCAHSTKHLSTKYWNGGDSNIDIPEDFLEPEIVFYPKTNSLAIQGHPESGIVTPEDKESILDYIGTILKL